MDPRSCSAQRTSRAIVRWVQERREELFAVLPPSDLLFKLPGHPADHEVWNTVGPSTEKGHGRLETRMFGQLGRAGTRIARECGQAQEHTYPRWQSLSASQLWCRRPGQRAGRRMAHHPPSYSSGSGRRITVIPSRRNRSRTSATVGARPSC